MSAAKVQIFRLTLSAIMPVSDEGEGDDRESGGGLFVPVLRKPRKKAVNKKRANTSPPYQTRSQYKKQRIQKKPHDVPTAESDIETYMSGIETETDSVNPESDSPAISANEFMHIGSLPSLQLNDERQGSGSTGALPRKPSGNSGSIQKVKPCRARAELNNVTDISENSRQFILTSNDPNQKLANINPFNVKAEIDKVCGRINKLENLQSGSIHLHTTSLQQTKTILEITQFLQVPVTANIAWNRQMTFGKIYLPEFLDEPLEGTLR